jgi:hypothetical protein
LSAFVSMLNCESMAALILPISLILPGPTVLTQAYDTVHGIIVLTPLSKKQIKAVEKTLRGKVPFPLNLQIPHTTRDSHFPTASAATNL